MSNPAAPALIAILQDIQAFVTALTTGDPATIGLRVEPALLMLLGQVQLQLPGLASAELTSVGTDVNSKINGWITSLKAQV